MVKHPPRPSKLIDLLDAQDRKNFHGRVWRAVKENYDVLRAARSGGRWDDGTFDVLYTSTMKEGAVAERIFHLSKGQPVVPSRPKYFVHELSVELSMVLNLNLPLMETLGLDTRRYGSLSYIERHQEYPSTQQIAEIANFLEFEAILVPSARWQCNNLIIFAERVKPDNLAVVGVREPIN